MAISVAVAVGDVGDPLVDAIAARLPKLRDRRRHRPGHRHGPAHHRRAPRQGRGLHRARARAGRHASSSTAATARRARPTGFFLGTTLLDHVTPEMTVYTDEIFGPVLSVVRADTYDEALALINANQYANGTAIFTRDGGAARQFQFEVEVGMVGINVPIPVPMAYYSFGGWKESLFGDTHMYGARGHQLLHPRQGRHLALARPRDLDRRPRLPADPLSGPSRRRASRADRRGTGAGLARLIRPARSADPRSPPARRPTWSWSAVGTPGCGRRCGPRSATRTATVVLLEAGRIGGAATGRNGGFCSATLTHGGTTAGAVARRDRRRSSGWAEPRRDRGDHRPATASTALRAHRDAAVATERTRSAWLREAGGPHAQADSSTATSVGPRWPRRPTSRGCWTATAPRSSTRPGWPGAGGTPPSRSACGSRADPGDRPATRDGDGVAVAHGRGQPCGAGRVGWPPTCSRPLLRRLALHTVPVYDYVLVTEPLTAEQLARSAGGPRRASATRGNQFHYYRLTRRQPDPVGRLRRDLPLRPPDRARAPDQRPRRSTCCRAVLRDLPAARGAAVHAIAGAA